MGTDIGCGSTGLAVGGSGALETCSSSSQGVSSSTLSADVGSRAAQLTVALLGAVDTGVGGGAQSVSCVASCASVGRGGAGLAVGRGCTLETAPSSCQGVASRALSTDVGCCRTSKTVGLLSAIKANIART